MQKIYYTVGIDFEETFDSDFIVNEDQGKYVISYVIDGDKMKKVIDLNVSLNDRIEPELEKRSNEIKEILGLSNDEELKFILL